MDQASSLRNLMNKVQQKETASVAILSTGGGENMGQFIEKFSLFYSKKTTKNIAVLGVPSEEKFQLKDYVLYGTPLSIIRQQLSSKVWAVPGELDFISHIRKDEYFSKRFLHAIEELESQSDVLLYYAGEGLDVSSFNLSTTTNRLLIIMKPTYKSFTEATNIIKLHQKIKTESRIGIVVDTWSSVVFQEQFNKLQGFCQKGFNYKIEPVGFLENKYVNHLEYHELFRKFNTDFLADLQPAQKLSYSVSKILL